MDGADEQHYLTCRYNDRKYKGGGDKLEHSYEEDSMVVGKKVEVDGWQWKFHQFCLENVGNVWINQISP